MGNLSPLGRCSETILEFLRTTDVGRKVPVEKAETDCTESGAERECPKVGVHRAGFTRFTFPTSNIPNVYVLFGRQCRRIRLAVARFHQGEQDRT